MLPHLGLAVPSLLPLAIHTVILSAAKNPRINFHAGRAIPLGEVPERNAVILRFAQVDGLGG
jgi:hypothetical protein